MVLQSVAGDFLVLLSAKPSTMNKVEVFLLVQSPLLLFIMTQILEYNLSILHFVSYFHRCLFWL